MLIGSVVWAGEIGVVWGKSRISTRNRKNTEMTVPISLNQHKLLFGGFYQLYQWLSVGILYIS